MWLRGSLLEDFGPLSLENRLFVGHLEGGQPVPHSDFEYQRSPRIARQFLGGLVPPFTSDLGDVTLSGAWAESKHIYIYIYA